MASDRLRRGTFAALSVCALALASGCSASVHRFPLKEPMWRDTDLDPATASPEPYVSSFAWDGADNLVFRPISDFLAVDPGGEAVNVNSMDEVPDSSWFTNRLGKRPMSEAEIIAGACDGPQLDPAATDGTWVIDAGKPNGANPGFRIKV